MLPRPFLLIAAIALLAVPVPLAGAHRVPPPGQPRDCGDQRAAGAGFFDVHSAGVRCRRARRVARVWARGALAGEAPESVGRFGCRYREDHAGAEYVSVRCTRSGSRRTISFHWGS